MNEQSCAEDIIDALMEMDGIDCLELARYTFDHLGDKQKDQFVEDIMDQYELYTMDQARDAISESRNI